MRAFILLSICLLATTGEQSYSLVWSDDFDGDALDTKKWQYEVNCDGGGNAELQCYTSRANNVVVRNGTLVVTAVPENYNGKQYTSGRINTAKSAAWKYGKFEIRAKMPNGIYLWPALWMMPRDSVYGMWAASGEIDIMESRGQYPTRGESTLHHGGGWPNNIYSGSGPIDLGIDMTAGYHIYSAIWTPTSIQFLVDGRVYTSQTLQRSFWNGIGTNPYTANGQPFDQYFYFIINLAVGGGFFGTESSWLSTQQARQWASPSLYVDYVKVYQLTDNPITPPAPAPLPFPTPSSFSSASSSTSSSTLTSSSNAANSNPTSTSGGCPAGMCGSAPCCNDQNNGPQCFSASQYSCSLDSFTGKYGLCGSGMGVCRGACYTRQLYSCINGRLTPGAEQQAPAKPSSTSYTSSSPSSTSSSASSSTTSTKSTTVSNGLVTASFCTAGTYACGGACYGTSSYCCVNGGLLQKTFCPPGAQ